MFKTIVSEITNRNNIKAAVRLVIAAKVETATEEALINNTDLEEDSVRVRVAGAVAGAAAATAARPATDAMIDKIADKIQSVRENRNARKNTETPEVI